MTLLSGFVTLIQEFHTNNLVFTRFQFDDEFFFVHFKTGILYCIRTRLFLMQFFLKVQQNQENTVKQV
jgi:hypothetical protein